MSCQLPVECLNDIFEYLEEDKTTLHSCLLVNRHFCKISVRILWRDIWRFIPNCHLLPRVENSILGTLIACLPNESKKFLYTSLKVKWLSHKVLALKPLFNYAAFCKVLSIYHIYHHFDIDENHLIVNELIKMFMNQFSSLEKLSYYYSRNYYISFKDFPARNCLADLSELCCSSDINSKFFYQLSRICHNLQSLNIEFKDKISNGLKELISLQNNLKNLKLFDNGIDWTNIIPAIAKHSGTLSRLHYYCKYDSKLSLSFVALPQGVKFSFTERRTDSEVLDSEVFEKLQDITFMKLKILKIHSFRQPEFMTEFLENGGKYLNELHIDYIDSRNHDSLDLSISKFCPNLKKLSVTLDELYTLKTIFNSCKYLESIQVWRGKKYLSEKELLEVVASHSPKNFCELKICHGFHLSSKLHSKDLELFFKNWKNRASKKLITVIIIKNYWSDEGNIKITEKYQNLGIIKKFEIKEIHKEAEKKFRDDGLEYCYNVEIFFL